MLNAITPMNNKQRIEILNNPYALYDHQAAHMIKKNNEADGKLILISIKAAEQLNRRGHFSEAMEVLENLLNQEALIDEETRGLVKYHHGVTLEELGYISLAIKEYKNSYKLRQNSWPLFRLAKIYEYSDPPLAFDFYSRATIHNSDLTDDASAYARTWTDSFYNEDIYKRFNPDLVGLDISLANHFLEYGFKEGRIAGKAQILNETEKLRGLINDSFDWKLYLDANPDLETLISDNRISLAEAEYSLINHYVAYGQKENRPLRQENHFLFKAPESSYNEYKNFLFRQASNELTLFLDSNEKISIGSDPLLAPSITIILVLFNRAELTLKALKSIEHSRFKDIALVIVDNNSTDRTKLLLKRLEGHVEFIFNVENLHFLESVNQAMAIVDTEYVVLLNNDAAIEYDTLDESMNCIKRFGNSAIVGGKVLHYDGYIQDAGSIVFEDGSCAGLGRRCAPNDHRFNFEREVDYISGAYLMTTHKIFSSLGGFNEHFKPAYYEETDLCFRARVRGIPIVYSPNIVVKHLEYGSSSKSSAVAHLMACNQAKFKTIHAEILQRHLHPALFKESQLDSLMHGHLKSSPRVLFIDDRIPSSIHGSGFSRLSQLVSLTREEASHVTIFATDYHRSKTTTHKLPIGVECIEDSRDYLRNILVARSEFYDIIIISREHNHNLFELIQHELKERKVFLKAAIIYDVESLFSIRDYTKKILDTTGEHIPTLKSIDLAKIASKEIERFNNAHAVIGVSRFELDIIQKTLPDKPLYYLGHPFVPIKLEASDRKSRTKISFMGAIHDKDSPNHDSLEWLYAYILPELSKLQIKDLCISIAGHIICNESIELICRMKAEYNFVEFLGEVENLGDFFSDSLLFLAPTRFAAGVPHKVHMASSFGVPSVTTTFVAEQMGWKDEESILVADSAIEYANIISNAYLSPSFLDKVLENMRISFNNDCSLDLFRGNLRQLLKSRSPIERQA